MKAVRSHGEFGGSQARAVAIRRVESRFTEWEHDMKVFLVFTHRERHSLNGALRNVAVAELEEQGHKVRITDLYAEAWKPAVDRADFPALAADARLKVAGASRPWQRRCGFG